MHKAALLLLLLTSSCANMPSLSQLGVVPAPGPFTAQTPPAQTPPTQTPPTQMPAPAPAAQATAAPGANPFAGMSNPFAGLFKPPVDHELLVAQAAIATGGAQNAINIVQNVLQKRPGDPQAFAIEGDALVALGHGDEAEAAYRRALAGDAHNAIALAGIGRTRLLANDPAGAEAAYRVVLREHPTDARALNNLGIALDMQGKFADAEASYRAALAEAPGMDGARVNLGLSLALAGDKQGSVAILRPLAADPQASSRVHHDLATALALAGDTADAQQLLAQDMPADQVKLALAGMAELRP